jgi:hypothetical protein
MKTIRLIDKHLFKFIFQIMLVATNFLLRIPCLNMFVIALSIATHYVQELRMKTYVIKKKKHLQLITSVYLLVLFN